MRFLSKITIFEFFGILSQSWETHFPYHYTGLRPIYVIFFEFLPISFQMKNHDDMRL